MCMQHQHEACASDLSDSHVTCFELEPWSVCLLSSNLVLQCYWYVWFTVEVYHVVQGLANYSPPPSFMRSAAASRNWTANGPWMAFYVFVLHPSAVAKQNIVSGPVCVSVCLSVCTITQNYRPEIDITGWVRMLWWIDFSDVWPWLLTLRTVLLSSSFVA